MNQSTDPIVDHTPEPLELVCYGEGYCWVRPEKPAHTTFTHNGREYEHRPCSDYTCRREHVPLITGQVYAGFHPVTA